MTMIRLPKIRSRARVTRTVVTTSRAPRTATSASSASPSTSISTSAIGSLTAVPVGIRRTVDIVRRRPPAPAIAAAIEAIAFGPSTWSRRMATVVASAPVRLGMGEGRGSARRDVGDRHPAGIHAAIGVVRVVRQAECVEGCARRLGIARLEHQLAVRVLGDADDPRNVHAAVAERRCHPGKRPRPIVELDREPDRHADTCCRVRWYPATGRIEMRGRGMRRRAAPHAPMAPRDGYPARMAPSPAPTGLQVQIFGLESDQATRAAIRFFKERRITIHLVDLRRKPIAAGELRRFVERLGAPALADREGKAWREAGLGYLKMTATQLAEPPPADTPLPPPPP